MSADSDDHNDLAQTSAGAEYKIVLIAKYLVQSLVSYLRNRRLLNFHLRLCLLNGPFLKSLPTKSLHALTSLLFMQHVPSISSPYFVFSGVEYSKP
jgi:hypothetical protein